MSPASSNPARWRTGPRRRTSTAAHNRQSSIAWKWRYILAANSPLTTVAGRLAGMAATDRKRPMQESANVRLLQFSLRSMFLLTAAAAILLGWWRLAGGRIGMAILGAFIVGLPFVWRPRWLFVWFLPLVWTTVAWNNFAYPGDEYGGFGVGSLAGLWIFGVCDFGGNINRILPPVLFAGAATVAVFGLLLDRLRAPRRAWALVFASAAVSLYSWSFYSFPTVELALAKNGSYEAYILPSMNLGLYAATLTMLAGTGLYRSGRRMAEWIGRSRRGKGTTRCGPNSNGPLFSAEAPRPPAASLRPESIPDRPPDR